MLRARTDMKVTASDALEFEAVDADVRRPRRGLKLFVWLAVISGLAGGGWYAYGDRLMEFAGGGDVEVPLIQAMAGPVRVLPENPGGLQVPNRDKLVYGRIQKGEDTDTSRGIERLLAKPETPLPAALAPQKVQKPAKIEPAPATSRVPGLADVKSVQPPPPPPAPPGATSKSSAPLKLAKRRAPLQLKKGAVRAPAAPAPPAQKVAPVETAAISATPGRIKAPTPAPAVSPASLPKSSSTIPPSAPLTAKASAAIPPDQAYRVQLAAARSPERARVEWDRMRRKHLDLLGDLGLTVTKADLGPKKGIFYRLRVGPLAGERAARTLCRELTKRKMGCLVVKPGR